MSSTISAAAASSSSSSTSPSIRSSSIRVGRDRAAAVSATWPARGDNTASRARSSADRSSGNASSASSPNPRTISRAYSGFPPDISWSRISVGRRNVTSIRSTTMRCSAATLIGPSSTRSTESRGRPPANAANASPPGLDVASKPTRSPSFIRRRANANAPRDGSSNHCMSSTATTREPPSRNTRRTLTTDADTTPGSTGSGPSSSNNSTTASARRCGAGSTASTSGAASPMRSRSPANATPASTSAGRVLITRLPVDRATPIASDHTSVLPIPAAPDSTRPAGPCATRARNLRVAATSASRPCSAGISRTSTTSPRREAPATTAVPHAFSLQRPSAQPSDVSIDPQATECKRAHVRRSEIPRLQRKVGATRRALDPQLSPSGKCRKAPAATHGGAPRSNPDRTQVLALADALCRRGARSPRRRTRRVRGHRGPTQSRNIQRSARPRTRGSERPGAWKKYRTATLRVTRARCPFACPRTHGSPAAGASSKRRSRRRRPRRRDVRFRASGNLRTPTWSASSMCRSSRSRDREHSSPCWPIVRRIDAGVQSPRTAEATSARASKFDWHRHADRARRHGGRSCRSVPAFGAPSKAASMPTGCPYPPVAGTHKACRLTSCVRDRSESELQLSRWSTRRADAVQVIVDQEPVPARRRLMIRVIEGRAGGVCASRSAGCQRLDDRVRDARARDPETRRSGGGCYRGPAAKRGCFSMRHPPAS